MQSFGNNLSEGHVGKRLILFSLPFLVSNIIQSLYNVADTLIVGNFIILKDIVVGLCTGGTVLIAQYIGARDEAGVRETTASFASLVLVIWFYVTKRWERNMV